MKKWFVSLCALLLLFTGCAETPAGGDAAPIQEQVSQPTSLLTPAPTDFIPAPLEPAEFTEEQWKQMQQTKTCMTPDGAVDLGTSLHSYPFRYVDYYGTYQGYTALRIYSKNIFLPFRDKEEVASCTLYYSGSSDILFCRVVLWNDNIFYQLPYAYSQGLITAEDVQSIAHYNNLRHFEPTVSASPVPDGPTPVPTEFIPAPIEPAELSEDVWARIRNSYQYVVDGEFWKITSLQDRTEPYDFHYYGTYQGYLAIFIRTTSPYTMKQSDEEIDGILIDHRGNADWLHGRIYLWQKDVFYQLKDAYNIGLISRDDLKTIAYYHNNYKY